MFLSNLEILRRCKEGLGVGLQAKYRHIRHPNRDWATRVRKYYYDDSEKNKRLEKNCMNGCLLRPGIRLSKDNGKEFEAK